MQQLAINLPLTDRVALFSIVALVSAGCMILVLLGASPRMLAVNVAALVCALIAYLFFKFVAQKAPPPVLVGAVVVALLATATWGVSLEGVHRWVRVGPIAIHVGFILLPLMIAAAPHLGRLAPLAILAAGGALWLQPDGGAAISLAAASIAAAAAARSQDSFLSAFVASAWAAVIWFKGDALAPVELVERVHEFAFARNPIFGVASLLLLAALPLPFLLLARAAPERRVQLLTQAGFWVGAVLASFIGNFPTPILGVGVAPIVGYAASWAAASSFIARSQTPLQTASSTTRD